MRCLTVGYPLKNQMKNLSASLSLALLAMLMAGCGPGIETGVVTGVVTKGSKPLDQVMVYFMPDPEKGTPGKHSTAVTDDQGRYSLRYYSDPPIDGAVVGMHRVTLEDIVPENYRGPDRPPKSRVPERMSKPWQTPLLYEVKPGLQEINIEVPE